MQCLRYLVYTSVLLGIAGLAHFGGGQVCSARGNQEWLLLSGPSQTAGALLSNGAGHSVLWEAILGRGCACQCFELER